MSGAPATTDRWLVLAVLALAVALLLTVLTWLAIGREMLELMSRAVLLEHFLKAVPVTEGRPEPASRSELPMRVGLAGRTLELEVLATAYAPGDEGVDGITASGLPVDRGVAAVDPGVIPLGSVVHVPGYGYAVTADTGGLIKGRRIDVYLPSRGEAAAWGVRRVKVTVYAGDR